MTWDVWLHELNGVVLFESAPVIGRRRVNRPIPVFNALTTAMKILLPDWSIRMAIAEQRKPIDPDPWTHSGPTPISGGKKQLIAYEHIAPRPPSADAVTPTIREARGFTAVFEWVHPTTGTRVLSCFDGQLKTDQIQVLNACSDRFSVLVDAIEAIERGQELPIDAFRALLLPPTVTP